MYAVLFLAPIAYTIYISFFRWDGLTDKQWRGVTNYTLLFEDPTFRTSLWNTLAILVVAGVVTFVVAGVLTLALQVMRAKFFARSVLFFPCLINPMVFGAAAGFIFSPDGPVNRGLRLLGVDAVPKWLAIENLFPLILAVLVWSATGYYTTIIMASVDQIPPELYEAADLEGASPLQRLRHITLPLSWEVITICAVLWTVSSVKVFELILVFGGSNSGNPPTSTWTTAMFVYATAFPMSSAPSLGTASAAAVISLVLVGLFTVLLRRVMRRDPIEY